MNAWETADAIVQQFEDEVEVEAKEAAPGHPCSWIRGALKAKLRRALMDLAEAKASLAKECRKHNDSLDEISRCQDYISGKGVCITCLDEFVVDGQPCPECDADGEKPARFKEKNVNRPEWK